MRLRWAGLRAMQTARTLARSHPALPPCCAVPAQWLLVRRCPPRVRSARSGPTPPLLPLPAPRWVDQQYVPSIPPRWQPNRRSQRGQQRQQRQQPQQRRQRRNPQQKQRLAVRHLQPLPLQRHQPPQHHLPAALLQVVVQPPLPLPLRLPPRPLPPAVSLTPVVRGRLAPMPPPSSPRPLSSLPAKAAHHRRNQSDRAGNRGRR